MTLKTREESLYKGVSQRHHFPHRKLQLAKCRNRDSQCSLSRASVKVMTKTVDYRTSSWQSHHDSFVCTPFDFETINIPISLESTPGLPLLRVHEQNRVGEAEGLRQTLSECTNKQREFSGFRRNGVRTGRRAGRSSLTKKSGNFWPAFLSFMRRSQA